MDQITKTILQAFGAGFIALATLNLATTRWLVERIDAVSLQVDQHIQQSTTPAATPPPAPPLPNLSVDSGRRLPLTDAEIDAIADAVAERLEGED